MNVDYWIKLIRSDPDAIHSFQNYLQLLISESSKQFKTAQSMDKVTKLQGQIMALENIQRDFNREQLKEIEHAAYESARARSNQGT